MNKKEVDWPQQLFVKHGNLFLKLLQNRAESTRLEVDGLLRIFEEFKVPKHSRILDVSCGIGRHSIPLAQRGYSVLGLDLSPLFIAKANATAKARKVNSRARFLVVDVRKIATILEIEEPFNVMLNLWSSHGYYGEEEDVRIFTALRNLAARNGLLVDDTVNRDYLIINPQPATVDIVGDMELRERRRFDPETSWHESNWGFYMKRGRSQDKGKAEDSSSRLFAARIEGTARKSRMAIRKELWRIRPHALETRIQTNNRLLSSPTMT